MANLSYKSLIVGTAEGELHPDIVECEKSRLIRFYQLKLERGLTSPMIKNGDDIIKSVVKIINRAIDGYERAMTKSTPERTFIGRINVLSKYQRMPEIWDDKDETKEKSTRIKPKIFLPIERDIPEDEVKITKTPIYTDIEDEDERKFFEERKNYYINEFEFNESSDQMMLETVIADEIFLRRLTNARLNNGKTDDELVDNIQKRYRENLKLLGLSRTQRMAENSNQKGSVAQISESLDKKLEEIKNLSDKDKRDKIIKKLITSFSLVNVEDVYNAIEELEFMRQRALRPDMENVSPIPTINEFPAMDEIESILKSVDIKDLN